MSASFRPASALLLAAFLFVPAPLPIRADEGFYPFDRFPSARVAEQYGFSPSGEWLDHLRLSSARLADGCSGSFVSPDGLVLTNHHCAHTCVEQISTSRRDHVADGFRAERLEREVRCPETEIDQLVAITDVTGEIERATAGTEGGAYAAARKGAIARIEKGCAVSEELLCEVVPLYHGGKYHLHTYRRFADVRLVFAPELDIAAFGGDPDNFEFPRYDLDMALLRVWREGKPAKLDHWLRWSPAGAREGDLTFVSGHPGSTSRLRTVAELTLERDFVLPDSLLYRAELRGLLTEFGHRGREARRTASAELAYVENSIKARRGMLRALLDPETLARKRAEEEALRKRVLGSPALRERYGSAWDETAQAVALERLSFRRFGYLEEGWAFRSQLFRYARDLVRVADEALLANEDRLEEYGEARLPRLRQELASSAPIAADLEIATLAFSLRKLREALGPDDPFVRKALGPKSPEELARELVLGTGLGRPETRLRLLRGGKEAIERSEDPMIRFARLVDADARAERKRHEDTIEARLDRASERIARARFELLGDDAYPDATFTLRLSYGTVRGWTEEDGRRVPPFTRFGGLFERATGRPPFALPRRWLEARGRLAADTPMNLVTDNDIIGGNSGSPLIDREGRIVGLIFDGNLHSLGGDYLFDERRNRAVAVDSRAILEALETVYGARSLADELRGGGGAP